METAKIKKSHKGKYLAEGVRTDCRNIIQRFGALKTLRYDAFTKIWREMKFPYIYFGRGSLDELIEFTEETLRIAKEMWLKSEALNEQAGGLYTLYGLYLKQPTLGWVKVRLTSQDYDIVEKFHEEIKRGGHHDANYILTRMHMIGAFRFCISDYSYGLEKGFRRYHEKDSTLQEVKEEPFYIKHMKNDDIFLKLNEAFKLYHESKCNLASGNSKKPPQVLDYVDSQFGQKIKEQIEKINCENDESSMDEETECGDEPITAKDKAKNSKFKLPWWMLPVKNRLRKESSSESEPENDADNTTQSPQKRRTTGKTREALNAELGMSGDDDDDDDDDNEQLQVADSSQPGCSYDMPELL